MSTTNTSDGPPRRQAKWYLQSCADGVRSTASYRKSHSKPGSRRPKPSDLPQQPPPVAPDNDPWGRQDPSGALEVSNCGENLQQMFLEMGGGSIPYSATLPNADSDAIDIQGAYANTTEMSEIIITDPVTSNCDIFAEGNTGCPFGISLCVRDCGLGSGREPVAGIGDGKESQSAAGCEDNLPYDAATIWDLHEEWCGWE